jgi:hypothetical protein
LAAELSAISPGPLGSFSANLGSEQRIIPVTSAPTPTPNKPANPKDTGFVTIDPRWSKFPAYTNELMNTIREQWGAILNKSRISPPTHSFCIIRFKLNSDGKATILGVPEETCGKQGVWAATGAVKDPQPYRKWSSEMIAVLGNEQEMTFRFFYFW